MMLQVGTRSQPGEYVQGRDVEQAGAICCRRTKNGQLRILLVGSRRNGRWGVPKGHVEPGEATGAAATREAFEEAGVSGVISHAVFGSFSYRKDNSPHRYHVAIYLLEVSSITRSFPEKSMRKRRWLSLESAVREVAQPGLRTLLAKLAKSPASVGTAQ